MVSELFEFEAQGPEKELLMTLAKLKKISDGLNDYLDLVDSTLPRENVTKEERRERYAKVNATDLLQSYLGEHMRLGRMLVRDYPWSLSPEMCRGIESEPDPSTMWSKGRFDLKGERQ